MDSLRLSPSNSIASAVSGQAARPHAPAADGRPDQGGVPLSNTGQKIEDNHPPLTGETSSLSGQSDRRRNQIELDAEWVELIVKGKRLAVERIPIPHDAGVSNAALIDWIAFTVRPPAAEGHEWVIRELRRLGLIGVVEELKGGYAGYTHKAQSADDKIRLCLIAWEGKNQAATVYVSFTGHGCARIKEWPEVRAWLETHHTTITRLDLAYDDFEAAKVSISNAVGWYQSGGFGAGGRMPSHRLHGDWLFGDQSRTGRTLEIGSRQGGKLCRIYEKGKQLGNPESPWVRVEVEWHNESRHIPYEALTNPGKYLAGAYECLRFLNDEQSRIQTQQRSAKVSFDRAMNNGRHLAGKLVNLALEVYQGDYAEVVEQLRREGYPARVEPYWHSVKDEPEMLADELATIMPQQDTPHLTRGERPL